MTAPYDKLYEHFDLPLMRQLRAEAYGQDIGQHSWVTAEELLGDIPKLKLSPESRLLDLGCGPAGPLTYIVAQTPSPQHAPAPAPLPSGSPNKSSCSKRT